MHTATHTTIVPGQMRLRAAMAQALLPLPLLLTLLPSVPPAAGGGARKNVLFVVFDDLSARHNVYGWNQSATPVADEFSKAALIFDRAYCNQAVCSPSRASFLSGRRPDRTQQWTFDLPPPNTPGTGGWRNAPHASDWLSFPQWFKKHGYYTAGAGKLYHPGDPAYFDPLAWTEPRCLPNASNPGARPWQGQGSPGREGFPYFGQGQCPYDQRGDLTPPPHWGCPVNASMQRTVCNSRTEARATTCFPDLLTLGTSLDFLRKAADGYHSRNVPFWIGVGFTKPHYPQIYPAEIAALVPKVADIDLCPNPNFTQNGVPMEWMSEISPALRVPATAAVTRQARHDYYAAAAFSDSLLGELLMELNTTGVESNTLIVLTADQ
jgi:iduronate 2-sulfatase